MEQCQTRASAFGICCVGGQSTCRCVAQDHGHRLAIEWPNDLLQAVQVESVLHKGRIDLAEEFMVAQHAEPGDPGWLVQRAALLRRALQRVLLHVLLERRGAFRGVAWGEGAGRQ